MRAERLYQEKTQKIRVSLKTQKHNIEITCKFMQPLSCINVHIISILYFFIPLSYSVFLYSTFVFVSILHIFSSANTDDNESLVHNTSWLP